MRHQLLATALSAGLAAGPPLPAPPAPDREIQVRPLALHRGLPHVFHDQALDSLTTLYPQVEFVEREREGRLGQLSYALVAWKRSPGADRVELDAVAVNGLRAWALELEADPSNYPGARASLQRELRALSGPYTPPPAEVVVRVKGRPVPVSAEGVADLLWQLEVLIASCGVETRVEPAHEPTDLEVRVRYREPRRLGVGLPGLAALAIEEISVTADTARGGGWPRQGVRHAGGEAGLAKCDGGQTLVLLCRPELRAHAPEPVTRNCHLAPASRADR